MDSMNSGLASPAESLRGTSRLPSFSKDMPQDKLKKQAQEFEAVFLSQVLSSMFKGIKTDGPFNGGPGEDTYRQLQMQEYGKIIAKRGGIGLANAIVRQVTSAQEMDHRNGAVQ